MSDKAPATSGELEAFSISTVGAIRDLREAVAKDLERAVSNIGTHLGLMEDRVTGQLHGVQGRLDRRADNFLNRLADSGHTYLLLAAICFGSALVGFMLGALV